nr:uncharacterized protein LOC104101293 [Nicotiana tomentosiformis]
MANEVVEFFQKQFTQEGDPTSFDLLNNVLAMVTFEQNTELYKMSSKEEVKGVVFSLSGDSASGPDDLRPISLSNFINKLISRVMHDRLEKILPSLISSNQSGFVKGRSIFENILLTHEIVTDIRNMGFAKNFINMIWILLSNNQYSVLVNGQASGFFRPTRGVKQGDPFSPALFILSAEWTDPLNHLAYADDTIIFASADPYSLRKVIEVLTLYEQTSGQLINKAKSSHYMHANVAGSLFSSVGAITGFHKGGFPFTYLGCPIFYTRRRKDYYNDVIKKVKEKLHS